MQNKRRNVRDRGGSRQDQRKHLRASQTLSAIGRVGRLEARGLRQLGRLFGNPLESHAADATPRGFEHLHLD